MANFLLKTKKNHYFVVIMIFMTISFSSALWSLYLYKNETDAYEQVRKSWQEMEAKVHNFHTESKKISDFSEKYAKIYHSGAMKQIKPSQLRERLRSIFLNNKIKINKMDVSSNPTGKLLEFYATVEGEVSPDTSLYNCMKIMEQSPLGIISWEYINVGRARDDYTSPAEFVLKFKMYFYEY